MSENCIFCQIIAGKAPANIVYRDDQVTAFNDREPAAPVHLLIVPNRHIESLNEAAPSDESLLGHMVIVAAKLAKENQISIDGYRVSINTGPNANQSVYHVHIHLMGGKPLQRQTR